MKIRIRDNSIRLRLSRPEVEHVSEGYPVQGLTVFPSGERFVYRLAPAETAETEALRTHEGLEIRVPKAWLVGWNNDEREGFRARLPIERVGDPDAVLDVRVEKDFHCMKPRRDGEDDGTYANPLANQSSHTD